MNGPAEFLLAVTLIGAAASSLCTTAILFLAKRECPKGATLNQLFHYAWSKDDLGPFNSIWRSLRRYGWCGVLAFVYFGIIFLLQIAGASTDVKLAFTLEILTPALAGAGLVVLVAA